MLICIIFKTINMESWHFDAPLLQVVIPLALQRRVEGLLQEHLDRGELSTGKVLGVGHDKSINQAEDMNLDENADSFLDRSVMEKVLQRRSLRMRNMQRTWMVRFITNAIWHIKVYSGVKYKNY